MSVAMGRRTRQLWLDTQGVPVITTTPNGERNAKRWGWTPATAIPTTALDVDKLATMLARLRFQEDMPYVIARAVVAHLTKGNENDE